MIPLPQQPRVILEEKNRGVYEIEGLYPGYGMTIGNAMRRVLLSSLEGSAITAIKIQGVDHEFSTMAGLLEDMIELTLNLKQVRFAMHGDGPYTATISIKGERKIKAGDIKTPSQLEVVNPEQHIATLTDKKASFEAELTVEKGLGFQSIEARSKEKVAIGTIALDAAFSAVKLVNYEVENMRVGDRTDYNRIRFHIETDGSIAPREAFQHAAKILLEQFAALAGAFTFKDGDAHTSTGAHEGGPENETEEPGSESPEKKKVEDLDLSTRVTNALTEAGIKTVGQLAKKNERKLKELEGLGEKGITEIKKALGNLGMILKQ